VHSHIWRTEPLALLRPDPGGRGGAGPPSALVTKGVLRCRQAPTPGSLVAAPQANNAFDELVVAAVAAWYTTPAWLSNNHDPS
jgi:hypothetical protein